MPSLLTHYLCGNETLKVLQNEDLINIIVKYRQVFNIGTQGPDILFYYKVWPWLDSVGINKLGERMHIEKVNDFFLHAVEYIKSSEGDEKQLLTAYLCGYLCHYGLDYNTHPYIIYKSGFSGPNGRPALKYSYYHRMLETAFDVLMAEMMMSKKPYDARPYKLISVGRREANIIGKMYDSVLNNTFNMKFLSGFAERAIMDMITARRIMQDRWGVKRKIAISIEKSRRKYPYMAVMLLPPRIKDGRDYLNLEHRVWYYPWDKSTKNTSSFVELFEDAVKEAQRMCGALVKCLSGEMDNKTLLDAIGNKSFSTGIDCSSEVKFVHYDCIFE